MLKWYYDSETKSCARFWYGGCGGNENRFNTQKECEKVCIPGKWSPFCHYPAPFGYNSWREAVELLAVNHNLRSWSQLIS